MAGKKGAPSGAKAKTNKTNNKKPQQKKTQPPVSSRDTQDEPDQKQGLSDDDRRHQQRALDVFRHAFNEVLSSSELTTTLQSVKQALYDRDFARAFGDPDHLAVYAARWSPTRALCYASVLEGIREHLEPLSLPSPANTTKNDDDGNETGTAPSDDAKSLRQLKILSIGGGAAELVAFGAFLNQHPSPLSGSITLLDSGPWETVITKLTTALTTPPPISKYASEAAKLSNAAMVPPSYLTPTFLQQDAVTLDRDILPSLLGTTTPLLVTILFTLNELFTASGIGKTTAFLLNLTATIPFGSLLLVVDSPGSYSETTIGKEAKRYPMRWLLDRVLLATRREPVNGRRWTKVESHESVWFRLASDGLDYPIALENMRYQMHLYRTEDAALEDGEDDDD
ncbi:hypothetical protein C8A01DRAFT_16587 [Parachaetomium inaequale]|uniref:25S rRNA (Uridine(2843)-N(3))-methyltransferase n=1 Tax=Parachaetomium inaequale TaxID=2588326 RepID=A0AAN6PG19_9PEZI|nr:hypothetical protein C8A01DRAFT_16587 [Parachaetomium inaequale]